MSAVILILKQEICQILSGYNLTFRDEAAEAANVRIVNCPFLLSHPPPHTRKCSPSRDLHVRNKECKIGSHILQELGCMAISKTL